MRKTKIVATIGPSSRDPQVLEQLVLSGMDVARLNLSHGTLEEKAEVIGHLRKISERRQRPVAVLIDLGGSKLRLGEVGEEHLLLKTGDKVRLTLDPRSTRPDVLPFPHPEVFPHLEKGAPIFIADGTIRLEVTAAGATEARAVVSRGGMVSSYKGVNIPGVDLGHPTLSEKDGLALGFALELNVDWVAVSFVQEAEDVAEVKRRLQTGQRSIPVVAKLERPRAVENLQSILKEADGVMVARGDLGIECPMARVPIIQKQTVAQANDMGKVSIIATQMLRSMLVSPLPTRAEISDITTAVLDGCDAILLSEETAVGDYPVDVLKTAAATIAEAETIYPYYKNLGVRDRTQAMAEGAASMVRTLHARPIVLTRTGRAAFEVARFRPSEDILVFAHDEAVLRRVCIGWGLVPVGTVSPDLETPRVVAALIHGALARGMIHETDVVAIVHGFLMGVSGTTNTVQVLDLKEYLAQQPGGPSAVQRRGA